MGFFSGLTESIWDSVDLSDKVAENLNKASDILATAELVWDSDQITRYRNAVDTVADGLEKGTNHIKNAAAAFHLFQAVRSLPWDVSADPDRSALAFGRMFEALGECSRFMPPPFSFYFQLFENAGQFFYNIKQQLDPKVHMKEPGIQEIIDNLP